MADPNAHRPPAPESPGPNYFLGAKDRLAKRRRKAMDEIGRNRRGEYKIPTWVLALCLVVFVLAWAAWIVFA